MLQTLILAFTVLLVNLYACHWEQLEKSSETMQLSWETEEGHSNQRAAEKEDLFEPLQSNNSFQINRYVHL